MLNYKNVLTIGYIYPKIKRGEIRLSKFEIEFYRKEDGECPFLDSYFSMNEKLRAKTSRTIELLKNNGSELREPYSKKIDEGIYELRTKQGSDISRVFYFFMIGHKIVFTNGYVKKKQRIDKIQLELAKKYRKEYLRGKERKHE